MNTGPTISTRLASTWALSVATRRKLLGLTQDQVAQVARITQQTVSNTESARHIPNDEVKIALARALGTTPGELFPWPDMADLVETPS